MSSDHVRQTIIEESKKTREKIHRVCGDSVGILDGHFLCRSVSTLQPPEPKTLVETATVREVSNLLQQHSIGCILIVASTGTLVGIFSERDYMTKVFAEDLSNLDKAITEFMTPSPIAVQANESIAFCLTLMSQGGFRHLPIVDEDDIPIGIVSVKDVVSALVDQTMDQIMRL